MFRDVPAIGKTRYRGMVAQSAPFVYPALPLEGQTADMSIITSSRSVAVARSYDRSTVLVAYCCIRQTFAAPRQSRGISHFN